MQGMNSRCERVGICGIFPCFLLRVASPPGSLCVSQGKAPNGAAGNVPKLWQDLVPLGDFQGVRGASECWNSLVFSGIQGRKGIDNPGWAGAELGRPWGDKTEFSSSGVELGGSSWFWGGCDIDVVVAALL